MLKITFALEEATKAQTVDAQLYSSFNIGARCEWVVSPTPQPLYHRVRARYPLYRRLGGLQGRF